MAIKWYLVGQRVPETSQTQQLPTILQFKSVPQAVRSNWAPLGQIWDCLADIPGTLIKPRSRTRQYQSTAAILTITQFFCNAEHMKNKSNSIFELVFYKPLGRYTSSWWVSWWAALGLSVYFVWCVPQVAFFQAHVRGSLPNSACRINQQWLSVKKNILIGCSAMNKSPITKNWSDEHKQTTQVKREHKEVGYHFVTFH